MNEDDTFNKLRRTPVADTISEFIRFCDGKGELTNEQMEEFLIQNGWTSDSFEIAFRNYNPSSQI